MAFYRIGFTFPESASLKRPHWLIHLHVARRLSVLVVHTPLFGFSMGINTKVFNPVGRVRLALWFGWNRRLPYKSGELLYLRNAQWYWRWRRAY